MSTYIKIFVNNKHVFLLLYIKQFLYLLNIIKFKVFKSIKTSFKLHQLK